MKGTFFYERHLIEKPHTALYLPAEQVVPKAVLGHANFPRPLER